MVLKVYKIPQRQYCQLSVENVIFIAIFRRNLTKKKPEKNKINCDSGVSEYFQIKCAFKNACVLAFIFNLMTKFCIHSTMLRIAVFFQWSWGTSLFYLVITLLVAAVYSLSCVWLFATPLTCSTPRSPDLFFTASDFTFAPRHIHNWTSFPPWPSCFILSGTISNCPSFFPSSILDTFQPGRLISQCRIFLPFHTVHGVLLARILPRDGLAVPSSSGPCFVRILHYDLYILYGPTWHGFLELHKPFHHDKAVIHEGDLVIIVVFNH